MELNIEKKEIDNCIWQVEYSADSEVVSDKRDEAVNSLRKVAIPGFRPGKAPTYAIKARCKDRINTWVAQQMQIQAYDDILFEYKVKAIGSPKFSNIKLKDNSFSCEMELRVKPKFSLPKYKGIEIPRPHFDRDEDKQVEKALQNIRMQFGDVEPYEDSDFVETGDQITMDFKGTIEGKEFDGGTAEGILYTIGSNQLTEDFDNSLLGMSAGEQREFDITFPDEVPNIGGKTAHFTVQVHMGTKRKPAPLNDELAKKVNMESIQKVTEHIRGLVNQKIQNTEIQLIKKQVANKMVDDANINVPGWLSNLEAEHITLQQKLDWSKLNDEEKEVFITQAKRNVSLSLILDSIREEEPEFVLSSQEVLAWLQQQVASQGNDPNKFLAEAKQNGTLTGLMSGVVDDFTLQKVAQSAKLID